MKDRADYQASKEISVFAASRIIKDVARGELKKRAGHKDLPLCMWLQSVRVKNNSRIETLLASAEECCMWMWNTWGASSAVTAHRLATKYRITYVQHACLRSYLSTMYRGHGKYESEVFQNYAGIYGEPINSGSARSSLYYFAEVQRKAGFVNRHLPLRVLLSPVVTSLILSHQLRSVINESAKNNARTARGSRVHHGRVDQRGCEAGRGPIGAECSHPNH